MTRTLQVSFLLSTFYFLLSTYTIHSQNPPFTVVEATIPDMQRAMQEGRITSRGIVQQYLARIKKYEDELNAIITLNSRALEEADARDRERAQGTIRGPLHGIPIAIKDNIHTTDMPTTGGALAFEGFVPPYEATITRNLRDGGAIIIAKTNMTELANWVAAAMPGNYNALVGYGLNPYDPRRDPRPATNDGRPVLSPGGSSSGAGTAANFWAANVGTETSGSILTPANMTKLVGIKPTVGRISRYGVIPITADQDTAGPMARTVTDAAILLGVLEGTPDPNDPPSRDGATARQAPPSRDGATARQAPPSRDGATARQAPSVCTRPPGGDYTKFLNAGALKGARIGVPRTFTRGALNADESRLLGEAIAVLERRGAVMIDPAEIPSVVTREARNNLLSWLPCSGPGGAKGQDASCSVVFKYGMKRDFNTWLASLGPSSPVKTLNELRKWNVEHRTAGAIKYEQAQLDNSDEMDLEADRARYEADRERDLRLSRTEGIDAVMKSHKLDALLFPGATGALIAAKAGYPTVIVPFGFVPNAPPQTFPEGFAAKPSPFGMSFTGMACSEPRLIELAYAFEQATKRRVPPPAFP
jgi:amidase